MPRKESVAITVAKISVIGTIVVAVVGSIGSLLSKPKDSISTPGISQEYIGRVLDADTQFPVSGAKVTLEFKGAPPIVYTDSNGVYRLDVTISKTTGGRITVEKNSYEPYSRTITLSPDINSIIDIRLVLAHQTSTPSPVPSSTFTSEPTATSTATTHPSATPTPLKAKTIADSCIFAETWKTDSTDANQVAGIATKADGCYDTGRLGVFANRSGALQIRDDNNKAQIASGIFMPVNSDSVIEFRVHVNLLYIVTPRTLAYINFAIAPADDPMATKNTARFKLQVEDTHADPFIYFVLADTGENNAAIPNLKLDYGGSGAISKPSCMKMNKSSQESKSM